MVMKWMKNVDTGTDIYGKWQENWLKWEPSRGWGFVRLASVPHLNFRDFPLDRRPGFHWMKFRPSDTEREGDAVAEKMLVVVCLFCDNFFQREDETFFF